jgi:hypothetical protein
MAGLGMNKTWILDYFLGLRFIGLIGDLRIFYNFSKGFYF